METPLLWGRIIGSSLWETCNCCNFCGHNALWDFRGNRGKPEPSSSWHIGAVGIEYDILERFWCLVVGAQGDPMDLEYASSCCTRVSWSVCCTSIMLHLLILEVAVCNWFPLLDQFWMFFFFSFLGGLGMA